MKAIEYYKKFKEWEAVLGVEQATVELIKEMAGESKQIISKRQIKSDGGVMALIREMNDKWNAMRKWDKRFNRDGYLKFWEKRIGEYKEGKNGDNSSCEFK